MRTLAAEIGISRSAVDKFHKQRVNPKKNWPKLRDWYMRTRGRKTEEYQTPPDLMVDFALMTIRSLPKSKRPQAIRLIADLYRDLHTEPGIALPEWVQMLGDLADKESQA